MYFFIQHLANKNKITTFAHNITDIDHLYLTMKKLIPIIICTLCALTAQAASTQWQPSSMNRYDLNGNDWQLTSTTTYTYTPQGKVETETTHTPATSDGAQYTRKIHNYHESTGLRLNTTHQNSNNATDWTNHRLEVCAYDSIFPTFVVLKQSLMWERNGWLLDSAEEYKITRNEKGLITSILNSDFSGSRWTPYVRVTFNYGDDQKPKEIIEEEYNIASQSWDTRRKMSNIKWTRFDGRLTDIDNFPTYNNAPSAFTIEADGQSLNATFEYTDTLGSFILKGSAKIMGTNVSVKMTHTILDQYGGYEEIGEQTVSIFGIKKTETSIDRKKYDPFGILIEEYSSETQSGSEEITVNNICTVTYDPDGYPTECIYKEMEPDLQYKISYGPQWTGNAKIETAATPTKYYNIQGIPVQEPLQPGLYIRQQGTKTTKIIVK